MLIPYKLTLVGNYEHNLKPSLFDAICRIKPTCPMVTDLAEQPKMCTVKQQI